MLNTIEEPISEEEYLKRKGEDAKKEKEPMAEEERTMINQGGLAVVRGLPASNRGRSLGANPQGGGAPWRVIAGGQEGGGAESMACVRSHLQSNHPCGAE